MYTTRDEDATVPTTSHRLSITQQRLWFLEQLSPGSTQYLVLAGRKLHGPLDAAALDTALTARHDALPMNFASRAKRICRGE